MSFAGTATDDWVLTHHQIQNGTGNSRVMVNYSATSYKLTDPVHLDYSIQFDNRASSGGNSYEVYIYDDPQNSPNRFIGNTEQSIWCAFMHNQAQGSVSSNHYHPHPSLYLRHPTGDADYFYRLEADAYGFVLSDRQLSSNGVWAPYANSGINDGEAVVTASNVQLWKAWYGMKLHIIPDGSDAVLHCYAADSTAIDSVDQYGEPTWTEVITATHTASGDDTVSLGTKQRNFYSSSPLTSGQPGFGVHGWNRGAAYGDGYVRFDSMGIKLGS